MHKYFQKIYGDAAMKRYGQILLNERKMSTKDLKVKHSQD
jgi:hypothetical protein